MTPEVPSPRKKMKPAANANATAKAMAMAKPKAKANAVAGGGVKIAQAGVGAKETKAHAHNLKEKIGARAAAVGVRVGELDPAERKRREVEEGMERQQQDEEEEDEEEGEEEVEEEVEEDDESDEEEEEEDQEGHDEAEMEREKTKKKKAATAHDEANGSDGVSASASASASQAVLSFGALGVCEQLVEACSRLGWKQPTPIQQQTLPHALQGRDIIGLAQTGSGKTGAFALPILQSLLAKPSAFFAAILSPTRELALQIAEQCEALGSSIGVKCAVVVGGVDMMAQAIALARRPHIVVGTPGRLVDHLSNTKGFSLRALKYLVLDEADRLLNMDFEAEIDEILKAVPADRTTFLFSATMTNKVAKLQRACLKNPVKLEVSSKYSTVDTLRQQFLFVPAKHKDCYLVHIMNELAGSTMMVFTRTCDATRRLSLLLRNLGFGAIPISGQMSQPKRLGALNKFKAGERSILICTDVASRGLDIPSVDMVVNYDIPVNSKDYIHRVGRTARAGRSGRAITIVTQYDVELFQKIEQLIGKKMETFPAEAEEVLLLLERVNEAQRLATLTMKEKDGFRKGGRKRKGGGDGDGDEEGGRGFAVGMLGKGKFQKKQHQRKRS